MTGRIIHRPHNCERPLWALNEVEMRRMSIGTQWQCDDCELIWTLQKMLRGSEYKEFCRKVIGSKEEYFTSRDPNEDDNAS